MSIKSLLISIIVMTALSCSNKNSSNTNRANDSIPSTKDSLRIALESISDSSSLYLLAGTYTSGASEGIYLYQFDTISGYSKSLSMVKADNPSYLTVSPNQKFVYAVAENDDKYTAINSFRLDKENRKLEHVDSKRIQGGAPCYIEIDNAGTHLITANYAGSSISLFQAMDNGSISPVQSVSFHGKGVDTKRQTQPHLHCTRLSPDGKYLFSVDLGTDKIHRSKFLGSPSEGYIIFPVEPSFIKVKDGSGPRHLDFHPNGKYAYLINELSGAVIAFNYKDGDLTEFQTIQADTLNAQGSADIHVSPDGRFLYASNRLKGDGIAIFSINQSNGELAKIGYQETGIHPRNFVITPNGKYLLVACRDSGTIQVFEINRTSGLLTNANKDIRLDMPVCLKFASLK